MVALPDIEKYVSESLLNDLHLSIAISSEKELLYVNESLCELTGYSENELIHSKPEDLFDEASDKTVRALKKLLDQKKKQKVHDFVSLTNKKGQFVDIHLFMQKIKLNRGEFYLLSFWDDTMRLEREAKVREQRDFLDSIYQGSSLALFILDVTEKGEFVYMGLNPAHERISGFKDELIRGKTPDELLPWVPEEVPPILKANYQKCVDAREVVSYEEMIPMKGKDIWWLTTLTPLLDEQQQIFRIIGAAADITKQKELETQLINHKEEQELANEELTTLNENLEKIVEERTYQLRERLKELSCLYELDKMLRTGDAEVGEIITNFLPLMQKSWLKPNNTEVRFMLEGKEYKTKNFREGSWKLDECLYKGEEKAGSVQVIYTPDTKQDPFLKEEVLLLKSIAQRITEYLTLEEVSRENEAQMQQFLTIMQNFPEIIYVTDPDTYDVIMVNNAFGELLGYDPRGHKCYKAFQGFEEPCSFCTNEILFKSEKGIYIWEHHNKLLDKHYYITDQLVNWPDGRKVRFEMAVDITELKKAQIEVRQLNEHLEEKVEERTAELEDAIKELEGFSYTVSHDLKAPLRSIIGYSNILLEDHREALPEDAQDVLDVIIRNTEKMRQLIDDILHLNRLVRKALDVNEVHLSTTANRVYRKLKGMTTGRKVDFEISGNLPVIQADPTMMEQLFSNLISNAIKFTAQREIAQITVNYEQMNGQHIVSVKDNGAGYDERYAAKLFQIFQRLHSGNEFPGSGVGLAICKRIMDKHNGKIWSESVLDEGATFYISFPLKQNLKNQDHDEST